MRTKCALCNGGGRQIVDSIETRCIRCHGAGEVFIDENTPPAPSTRNVTYVDSPKEPRITPEQVDEAHELLKQYRRALQGFEVMMQDQEKLAGSIDLSVSGKVFPLSWREALTKPLRALAVQQELKLRTRLEAIGVAIEAPDWVKSISGEERWKLMQLAELMGKPFNEA